MKKHLLIGASIIAFGITTTAIYAQVTGTSVVDKMKAVAHSFTLATTLNPSDTGLTSDPVKGKKTGDILTAGEYNRLLELVSEGGGSSGPELWKCTCGGYMNMVTTQNLTAGETCVFGNGGTANNVQYSSWSCTKIQNAGGTGGGTGWVDVPLTDTNPFDQQCMYRFVTQGQTYYAETVHEDRLYWISTMYFAKTNKSVLVNGIAPFDRATKIEKLCGGGGSSGSNQILPGWPNTIACNRNSAKWGVMTFESVYDGKVQYSNLRDQGMASVFDLNTKKFVTGYLGQYAQSVAPCYGKDITDSVWTWY